MKEIHKLLTSFDFPVILVKKSGEITYANEAANTLLFKNDPSIKSIFSLLGENDPEENKRIKSYLKQDIEEEKKFALTTEESSFELIISPITLKKKNRFIIKIIEQNTFTSLEEVESKKLQRMLDISPLGVLQYELDEKEELILTGYNQRAAKILGVDLSGGLNKTLEENFPSLTKTDIIHKYKDVAKGKLTLDDLKIEYQDKAITGTFNFSAIQISSGKLAVFFSDITESKKAVDALRENEKKYKTLFESAKDAIFILKNSMFIDCNHTASEMFGYEKKDIVGKYPYDLSPKYQRDGTLSIDAARIKIKSAIEGSQPFFEWQHQKKDGTVIDTEVTLNKFILKGEEFLQGIVRDVTLRKQTEEELKEKNRTITTLMSNLPGMAYRCKIDRNWTMEYISEGCRSLTGYSEQSLINNNEIAYSDLIHPDDKTKVWDKVMAALDKEKPFTIHYRVLNKNGEEKWVWEKGRGITDGYGNYIAIEGFITDVTDRKLAEEKVNMLAHALKSITECVLITDLEGKITFINNSFIDTFGYFPDEIIGKTIDFFYSEENPPNLPEQIWKETNSGGFSGELLNVRKDGSEFPIYLSTSVIRDDDNNPISYISVSVDISERYEAKKALEESEERFRSLVDTMLEAALIVDWTGKILFANSSAADLVEIDDPKEGIGKNVAQYLHPGDREIVKETLISQRKTPSDFSAVYKVIASSGEEKWVESLGTKIKFGNQACILVTLRDVTKRKEIENQIHILTNALQSAANGIIITNKEGEILWVNDSVTKLTGYNQEELIGQNPNILNSGFMGKEFFTNLWETILSGKVWRGELVNTRKEGSHYSEEMTVTPVKTDDGEITHFIAVKQDISDRKKAERDLKEAKENAEVMNRLKSNFLANMSHELRTPLVGILGFAELLKDEIEAEEQSDMAERIYVSGKRLMETLNSLLDLSRIESNRIEVNFNTINLNSIVEEQIRLFEVLAGKKKIYLKLKSEKDNVLIKADDQLFRQILNNVLNNAIKYTHDGGVEVVVDEAVYESVNYARLRVIDTGIGIPEENISMIFQEFRQVSEGFNRHFEGTGLGLTLTKRFVDLMKGKIWVESAVGHGSTFTVIFPLVEDEHQLTTSDVSQKTFEVSDPGNGIAAQKKKILMVENDEASREVTKLFLRDICDLTFASTGEEALEIIKENKFSAILMDINLGTGISGIEATKKIREIDEYKDVPVIAVTAFAMAGDKEEFITAGCTDYISKPFNRKQINQIVKNLV